MSNIKKSKSEVSTGSEFIDSLPEKYRNRIKVGNIIVTKTDVNTYEPYHLIVHIAGDKKKDNKPDIITHDYMFHKDIGKSEKDCVGYFKINNHYGKYNFETYYLKKSLYIVESKEELDKLFNDSEEEGFDLENYTLDSALNNENALVHVGSTSHLQGMKDSIEKKADELSKLTATLEMKMFEQRKKLDIFKRKLDKKLSILRAEVGRIKKIIWTIELYLGIKEDVVQIHEGEAAPADEPLRLFQTCSYMDEEVANPEDQGIDMNNIDKFDDWMCKHNTYHNKKNYEILMYPRSLLMFKIRRDDKKYTKNPFLNSLMNQENHKTYILIRNGDKLYRIWADINIQKFFPDADEFQNIGNKRFHSMDEDEIETTARDKFIHYQRHFVMLQGLIDRTEVFNPMPKFKITEEFNSDKITYLYTNSIKLPTERPLFSDWLKSINKHLEIGCRIIWAGNDREWDNSHNQSRFSEQFYSWKRSPGETWGLPSSPEYGLYTLEGKTKEGDFFIKIPNDTERWDDYFNDSPKRKVMYKIFDYDRIINYDLCCLDDVDYYMHSREDRKNYLEMMPILIMLKKKLEEDKKLEDEFASMMLDEFKRENINVSEWRVLMAIDWWKVKNKWKRSINKDDTKAYRMIKKHVILEYKNLKNELQTK